ncbi:MAG: Eco57I restriction-modification methylase domain-containing protein [Candidatus Hodarchaeales archaeon]|jgi:type I restriction-modification system DNA methylase subunit
MYELYSCLKPYYEKFLQRGQLYGLSPHEIHETGLNLFSKLLGVIILAPWDKLDNGTTNSFTDTRKIRMFIHQILFQEDTNDSQLISENRPIVLREIIKLSHLETQFKDSLSSEEWDRLVELLLAQQWTLSESFKNITNEEKQVSPEFLSYFYENVLNDFENFFSLTPKISKRKHKGVFYTPWSIVRDITDRCFDRYQSKHPNLFQDKSLKIKILDPSCGTGSFLVYTAESLYQRLKKNTDLKSFLPQAIIERCIYGIDLSPSSLTVAKFRLLFWILNMNPNVVNSLPSWLFRNIKAGNSLFGLCNESIQYPLDYSTALSQINKYLMLDIENKPRQFTAAKENWLKTSLQAKEAKKGPFLSSSHLETIERAEKKLLSLVNVFYQNWIKNRLRNYPRPKPLKKGDLDAITPFHWGIAFPEVILLGGFDLLIGNPPYGRSILSKTEKSILKLVYRASSGENAKKYSLNAASAFIERSITILKTNGILGLIIPFSILRVEEFETLRKLILERTVIWNIKDESAAFADVTLEMCSIFLTKQISTDYDVSITPRPKIHAEPTVPISIFKKYARFMIYYDNFWEKVTSQGLIKNGVVSGDYGIDHRIVKKDLISKFTQKYPIIFLHSGRRVAKYALNPKFFQWSKPHPSNERFTTYFREPRLINTAIGNRFRVAYKPEKIVPGTNVSILEIENSYHYFPMLILLNSDLINYLLKRYILNFSHLTVYLHKYYTKLIPIKYPHDFENEFKTLASYLIFLSQAHFCGRLSRDKRTEFLLNLANYLVYDLYFPEMLGISSNLAISVGRYLKPIEIESFLDLILFQENETDLERLLQIVTLNWKIIRQVTNRLREDEEIHQHKKSIFNHKIVKSIRNGL